MVGNEANIDAAQVAYVDIFQLAASTDIFIKQA